MIGSRIALLALACLSPVMAAAADPTLSQKILLKLSAAGKEAQLKCYTAAAEVHDATAGDDKKKKQTAFDEAHKEKAAKDACAAAVKAMEEEIKSFKEAHKDQTEPVSREEKIMAIMKGGSSSMLLIIIIIAAVLIVGGVLVYCFCCRSSSSASDDDL